MGQYEWLVLTCRACRRVIKLPPAMAGKHVICPHCRTKVTVPKDAPVIQEAAIPNQIPVSRQNEDATNLRGGHEEWEVGQRPIGGDLDFRSRLHSTHDPDLQPDPDKEMKRVNMRRRRLERTNPDFDDPEMERRKKRRRKSRSSGSFDRTFTKGLIGAVIGLTITLGWLGWERYNKPKPPQEAPKQFQLSTELTPASDGQPPLEVRRFEQYEPALAAVVRGFAHSKTVDEMLAFVRDRERVEPRIRAYYTQEKPWRPIEINNTFKAEDSFHVDGDFIIINLLMPNGDTAPITLERKGNSFLVDWEAFTGYCEMSWDDLRIKRPTDPIVMRVVVERSPRTEYWNWEFTDKRNSNCYLLRSLKSQYFLYGYTTRDSAVDIHLRQAMKLVPPPANELYQCYAILRVSFPPNSQGGSQVHIHDFLENGWVFRTDR